VVHLGVAESSLKGGEVLIQVIVGVGIAEAYLQEQPTGLAEKPIVETGAGIDRQQRRIGRLSLAAAAALASLG